MLQDRLKNGASKFLCDWHLSDDDFDINQYGEWRLRKDALPNPQVNIKYLIFCNFICSSEIQIKKLNEFT